MMLLVTLTDRQSDDQGLSPAPQLHELDTETRRLTASLVRGAFTASRR